VAAGALERLSSDKRLIHGMMGLFTYLSPDIPMTVEAEVRLGSHQQLFHSPVDGMAAIARIARKFMSIHIPERHGVRSFVAGHASCGPFCRVHFLAIDKNGHASASALFNMLGAGTVTGFASVPVRRISRHCLFAMDGFYILGVIRLMAIFASFRTHILRIPSDHVPSHEDERKSDSHQRKKEHSPFHIGSPPVYCSDIKLTLIVVPLQTRLFLRLQIRPVKRGMRFPLNFSFRALRTVGLKILSKI
jgi:hypothetical protein